MAACQNIFQQMETVSKTVKFPNKFREHVRGSYPTADIGVGYAGGAQEAFNCFLSKGVKTKAWEILESPDFSRLAGFINHEFSSLPLFL